MNEQLKVIISAEIDKLKTGVNNAKSAISNFKSQVEKASKNIDKTFADMGAGINKTLKGIGTTLAGFGAALLGTAAATEEYRNNQALLATAFETAGSSATVAKETYNDLYRVLGDGGQATEAAQHLAKLTNNEKDLSEWTNICKGIYGTFGASLPIESLTEAANETAKVGTTTGALSDALNWAGISEDEFNEKLAACNTEAEREKLIRETLNGIYSEAATNYEANNAEVLAQRDAQAALQEQLALVGSAMTPILTLFTQFAGEVLTALAPHIQNLAEVLLPLLQSGLEAVGNAISIAMGFIAEHWEMFVAIAAVIGTIVAAIGLYNTVAAIKAAMDAAQVSTIWGLVAAHAAQAVAAMAAIAPYVLAVAAIAAVVAAIVWMIQNWDKVKEAIINVWNKIKAVWGVVAEWFKNLFSKAWEGIKSAWSSVKTWFSNLWNGIKNIFSSLGSWFSNLFSNAWKGIQNAWNGVKSWFSNLWNGIKTVFASVGSWFSGIFSQAWNGIKNAFSAVSSFFSGVWNTIKSIFSNVGTAIAEGIKGAVSGAVNKVLSVACNIINGFISAINFAIGVINAIPGVNIRKLDKLSVPAMAQGGVVDSATLAMIGENGKEAVVPLENNLEWLDKLAGMLNDRMGGGSAKNIVLNVDGKTFAQASIDSLNQLTRQTGSLDLVIV